VRDGTGVISGPQPRSVLLGVYRYLRALGCRFLFPGSAGELFPDTVRLPGSRVQLREQPACRHRGVCIEGANRLEVLLDMIDFLPKLGFNSYFIQFQEAYAFFRRWYCHTGHPTLQSDAPYSMEEARANVEKAAQEIAKRGLVYHAVGHGWTCEPFGIPGLEWARWKAPVPEQTSRFFALVNGKRELWDGVPLNTSICMSNGDGRKRVVEDVLSYARSHPDTDVIHLWLADGSNNQCECPQCAQKLPSDWYLILLNEIDAALTAAGMEVKLCFLLYCDLLWPPQQEQLRNPDRFVLMFAPISRTYRSAFTSANQGHMTPYVRNRLKLPTAVADNLAYLHAWQQLFTGDSFLFDYHYMWAHQRDAGCFDIARVLYEDLTNLKNLGLGGLISCQVQRAMFPNALGITVMAGALWGGQSFEAITQEYLRSLYGIHADKVGAYLRELSRLSTVLDLEHPQELSAQKADAADSMARCIRQFLADMNPEEISPLPAAGVYLVLHGRLWLKVADALSHLHRGNNAGAAQAWQEARALLWEAEPQAEQVLDCYNFQDTLHRFFEQHLS